VRVARLERPPSRGRERRDHGESAVARARAEVSLWRGGAPALADCGRANSRLHAELKPGAPRGRAVPSRTACAAWLRASCALCLQRCTREHDPGRTRRSPGRIEPPTKNRQHRTVRLLSALARTGRPREQAPASRRETLVLLDDEGKPWTRPPRRCGAPTAGRRLAGRSGWIPSRAGTSYAIRLPRLVSVWCLRRPDGDRERGLRPTKPGG
jgi:hypothetical protein